MYRKLKPMPITNTQNIDLNNSTYYINSEARLKEQKNQNDNLKSHDKVSNLDEIKENVRRLKRMVTQQQEMPINIEENLTYDKPSDSAQKAINAYSSLNIFSKKQQYGFKGLHIVV